MSTSTYEVRLVKDLKYTFNGIPLTVKEIAKYWRRSASDVGRVASLLKTKGILIFNDKNEMVLVD